MYLYCDRGNWYLYQQQKDKNNKWFKRTVAIFGKTKPVFQIPFIYRGCAEDLVRDIKNKSVDLLLTDPPYGLTQNQWDVPPNWKENVKEYERVLKDNGLIAIFGTLPNIITVYNVFTKYFSFRFDITWIKGKRTAMWSSHNLPLRTTEFIFVFSKKDTDISETTFNYKAIGEKGEPYVQKRRKDSVIYTGWDEGHVTISNGIRYPVSHLEISSVTHSDKEYTIIPNQKPERLIEYFVRWLTNVNDVILDPYLGSGTIAKVSMENARMCIGSEINPICFPIITKRLKSVMQQYSGRDITWQSTKGFLKTPLSSMMEAHLHFQ